MTGPGHASAFSKTTRSSHAAAESALPHVRVPSLVLMGSSDPDFPDPEGEARWIADAIGGRSRVLMIDDAGHYPQSQRPDAVNAALVDFLGEVNQDA